MTLDLGGPLPELLEEVDVLYAIAKGISVKHKRTIVLCYSDNIYSGRNIYTGRSESPLQVVKNKKSTPSYFERDKEFRKKLKTNIKDHLPEKMYNFLVLNAIESKITERALKSTAYDLLDNICDCYYHTHEYHKFFVKITKEKILFYP